MEDTSNLRFFLALATCIGKFPYRISYKRCWRFYVCCWCLFSMFLNTFAVIFEIRHRDNYFFYILPIIVYVQWMILNVQCSYDAIKHVDKWEKLLSDFSKYDDISPNVCKGSLMNRYIFIVTVVVVNMSFVFGTSLNYDQLNYFLTIEANWVFHINAIDVIYAIIFEILTLLKERYKEIKEEVSTRRRRRVVSKDHLRNLAARYKILNEISTSLDENFGKLMLILLANTFCITIDLIGITLTVKVATKAIVQYAIHSVMLVATAVYILSIYDSTEKLGKEIVKFCYIRQAFNSSFTDSLVKYFDELSPRFTADGYFALNKTVLPSLLAAIATYVVVMLQLKPN